MGQFIVSARKYRPKTFDEVIGQNHIASTLKNALISDQLAHAFLFCGPRGVGKTTCARILAKVINCQNKIDQVHPCNECSSCLSFNDNASFNIIELDAASNNSVEAIRNLIEQVRFKPQQGAYKVFIIDEVHMLTQSAFNAFLKTLEEPPPYAIFILATTEKHKILPTILSRCQIFDFKRIQTDDIIKQLNLVMENEGREAEMEALHIIAQKADGAMRDALSIYDRIASTSDKKITYADVIANLNILDHDYYFKMVDHILMEDHAGLLLSFDEILNNGFDGDLFLNGFANHLRNLLVCKDPQTISLLDTSDGLKKKYLNQSQAISSSNLLTALNIANTCDIHYGKALNKRLHVEIALSKMCYMNRQVQLSEQPIQTKEKKTPDLSKKPLSQPIPKSSTAEIPKTEPIIKADKVKLDNSSIINTPKLGDINLLKQKIKSEEAVLMKKPNQLDLKLVKEIWDSYEKNSDSPTSRAVLRESILEVTDGMLKIYVSTNHSKDKLNNETNLFDQIRDAFQKAVAQFEIIVDKARFPDKEFFEPKKLLSNKEKFDKLKKMNPLMDDLKTRFDLTVDND